MSRCPVALLAPIEIDEFRLLFGLFIVSVLVPVHQ